MAAAGSGTAAALSPRRQILFDLGSDDDEDRTASFEAHGDCGGGGGDGGGGLIASTPKLVRPNALARALGSEDEVDTSSSGPDRHP